MNPFFVHPVEVLKFLNGVCRHERATASTFLYERFLNGVCRHELFLTNDRNGDTFLNGVCRHEQQSN